MKKRLALIFFMWALHSVAIAEKQQDGGTDICAAPLLPPERPKIKAILDLADLDKDAVLINTDAAGLDVKKDILTLMGNAELAHDNKQLRAQRIKYDQQQDTAWFYEDVHYWGKDLFLRGDAAIVHFDTDVGTFEHAQYIFNKNKGWGNAKNILSEGKGSITRLANASYTTCDPGDKFWEMYAKKTIIYHEKNWASARHAVLRIKGFPVLYSPYLALPIGDERKSGFLSPSYSERTYSGREIKTPYYWNIAPNMDATIIPRFLLDTSAVMLMGEYRYLFKQGQGHISVEYLPEDPKMDNHHRKLFNFRHQHALIGQGTLSLELNRVSDKSYLQDFGQGIASTGSSFLESHAKINYKGQLSDKGIWNMNARIENFQTVNKTAKETYTRLPSIAFGLESLCETQCVDYGIDTEFTYFKAGNNSGDTSTFRADLYPYLSYPIDKLAYYIRPKLGLRYTHYQMQHQPNSTQTRALPILSVDSKLFLEREMVLFDNDFLQTLDFQTYYLFVPEKKQSMLPIFDTSSLGFSRTLFSTENRFTGPDRIGDANQIAVTVTSALNHQQSGKDIGRITFGQLYYFRDRTVTLQETEKIQDRTRSPIFVEAETGKIGGWHIRSTIQWDQYDREIDKATTKLSYKSEKAKVFELTYHTSPTDRQTDTLFRWPIGRNWSILGRWRYTLEKNETLAHFAGIEYNHCCWGMRILAHRFPSNEEDEFKTEIFFQIELKGLAWIGRDRTVNILKQQISGYQLEF